jgi:protein-disulfide isomerase
MMPLLNRRQTLTFGLALTLAPTLSKMALAQEIHDVVDMSLGEAGAPVTVIEYASFTCPHCAAFAEEVYPEFRRNYVETGKARLVFREVYFDRVGLWASMIARCAPADRYFGIAEVLFARQRDWATGATSEEVIDKLYGIGRQAGLTDPEMDACMADQAFAEALVEAYQKNSAADNVDSTPTLIINGEKNGNLTYAELAAKIDSAAPAD